MAYCCRGFRPSLTAHRDVDLVQPHELELHDDPNALAKRDFRSCVTAGVVGAGGLMLAGASVGGLPSLIVGSAVAVSDSSQSPTGPTTTINCLIRLLRTTSNHVFPILDILRHHNRRGVKQGPNWVRRTRNTTRSEGPGWSAACRYSAHQKASVQG